MKKLNALSKAVIYALTANMAVHAQEEKSEDVEVDESKIPVVYVTASKRVQNNQETPIAVQALTMQEIKDQNIGNFDDFVRYMPNVSVGGRGPGQNDVFIRGMAIQPITTMLSGAQGTMPNVALYIDEQPVTAPGRNLDVFATDLQRIEVLPGPQGTLFGASSQAGTVRYITNKPRQYDFEAGISSTISDTHGGEMNNSVEGYMNFPLTKNFAARLAFYNVHRGGYIDNKIGEFTLDPEINPNVADSVQELPDDTTYETTRNTDLAEDDFNDSYYKGYRLGMKYWINEEWDFLVQHAQQELGADGVFDYDPEVGDLAVNRYFPDKLRDEFNQTSWTLTGRMEALELVYTGAFLDREIEQSIDYTGYNNSGAFIPFYTCTYDATRACLDPTKGFKGYQEQERFTNEFRIATDPLKPLRVTAGVFFDDFEIKTLDDYYYMAVEDLGFFPNAPIASANNISNATRPLPIAFYNDITRSEEHIAVFGEVEYDFTDKFTGVLGLRRYEIESDFTGSSNFANNAEFWPDGDLTTVEGGGGRDYDSSGGHTGEPLKIDDIIPKISGKYQYSDDIMFYATYSEGFRPGGFNRGGGLPSANPDFPTVNVTYSTDDVQNYEFGWKSTLMDGSFRWNGNLYRIKWTDMQVSRFDPVNVSILTFIENAADSEITGLESNFIWRTDSPLTLYGAFSLNQTELTNVNAQVIELAPIGSELPMTPEFQANLRAQYDFEIGEYLANWQLGIQHASKSYNSIVAAEREQQDAYTLANFSVGIEKDLWKIKFFIDNVTDERAELFINNLDDIRRVSTNRPRTTGISVSYTY